MGNFLVLSITNVMMTRLWKVFYWFFLPSEVFMSGIFIKDKLQGCEGIWGKYLEFLFYFTFTLNFLIVRVCMCGYMRTWDSMTRVRCLLLEKLCRIIVKFFRLIWIEQGRQGEGLINLLCSFIVITSQGIKFVFY